MIHQIDMQVVLGQYFHLYHHMNIQQLIILWFFISGKDINILYPNNRKSLNFLVL
jgi:hypothetical protein